MSSTRRGVGLSAFSRTALTQDSYASHGASLRSAHAESLANQLSVFQAALHNFSISHGEEIRSNPTFRAEFARMCNAIGVDPLASSHHRNNKIDKSKGGSFWTQMLGGSVNDFYFDLAVKVVEICRETRDENGGMISIAEVKKRVLKGKAIGSGMDVSEDDVLRAVKSLEPLGSGISAVQIASDQFIRFIPKELNRDQAIVLEAVQLLGYISVSMLQINLQWEEPRAVATIEDLVGSSMLWVDLQASEPEYWSSTRMHDPSPG